MGQSKVSLSFVLNVFLAFISQTKTRRWEKYKYKRI